jgi:hypothetical protein
MEDNSAVVTMANNDTSYAKKCKHFLMVVNYVKEQIATGQIEARKIFGKLNNADLHTKPLRSQAFTHMAAKILGQPSEEAPPPTDLNTIAQVEIVSSDMNDMGVVRAPKKGLIRHRSDSASEGAKRRKAHVLRYITAPQSESVSDT